MKLFITGATGFIGSHCVEQALAAGHEVVALRRSPSSRPRLPLECEPRWLDKPLDEPSEADLAGCDAVLHLAAHSINPPYDTLDNCLRWNLLAPLVLFQSAVRSGVTRFVVAGSCYEYGRAAERYDFIPPDAPLEPTNSYAVSKAEASMAFMSFAEKLGVRLSIHRIFHAFGEGDHDNRLWPSLRRAALAGDDLPMTAGEPVRDFTPVELVAERLLSACQWDVEPGKPVVENVGTGRPQTIREFAEHWWTHWNASGRLQFGVLPYRRGEVMRYVPLVEPRSAPDSAYSPSRIAAGRHG